MLAIVGDVHCAILPLVRTASMRVSVLSVGVACIVMLVCLLMWWGSRAAGWTDAGSSAPSPTEHPHELPSESAIRQALERLPAIEDIGAASGGLSITGGSVESEFVPTAGCIPLDLLKKLIEAPREQDLRCIWDSVDFNPRRVMVPLSSRQSCELSLMEHLRVSAQLRRLAGLEAMKQFKACVGRRDSKLHFISVDDYAAIVRDRAPLLLAEATVDGELDLKKLRFMPALAFDFEANLCRWAGDGWFCARTVEMDSARPAYEAMAFTGLELVRGVIDFALAFSTIDSIEADQLRARASVLFDALTKSG